MCRRRFVLESLALCLINSTAVTPAASVPIAYATHTPPSGNGNMDSMALWVAPDPSESLLFITDKDRDSVQVHDPVINTYLFQIGGTGSAPGKFQHPNGIAVAYDVSTGLGMRDVLFVVERDNGRVQTFSLPDLTFLGQYGNGILEGPMGIAIQQVSGTTRTWITDQSGEAVVVFDLAPIPAGIGASVTLTFPTPNVTLESILVDTDYNRVFVCDEEAFDVMVFTLGGNLVTRIGGGIFSEDPEGIVLVKPCSSPGYVIITDQKAVPTEFEVFDRVTLQYIGQFTGPTQNTDGTWLTPEALPNLPGGSFYASHADSVVHAYHVPDIAAALGLDFAPCSVAVPVSGWAVLVLAGMLAAAALVWGRRSRFAPRR